MFTWKTVWFGLFFILLSKSTLSLDLLNSTSGTPDIDAINLFLSNVNSKLTELYNKETLANYKYEINKLQENLNESENATNLIVEYVRSLRNEIDKFDLNQLENESDLMRQISRLPKLGYEALENEDLNVLKEVIFKMNGIYKNIKLCSYKEPLNCNLTLIPHIQNILHTTNDIQEIEYYWNAWRNSTGINLKDSFIKFIEMYQKTAKLNGFEKPSQMWYNNFDEENTIEKLDSIMTAIRPLFVQFHAHIRFLLRQKYGTELIKPSQPYPQHLSEIFIGEAYRYDEHNGNLIDFPFPEKKLPNITEILVQKKYTPEKFFDISSKFFSTIGLEEIPKSFWTEIALPVGHPELIILNCWNKAWHFYGNTENIKLTYCPNIDFRQFLNMYEVLTEVHYYKQIYGQPTIFQNEPLPNFIDAIGRVISMSVSTPKYLEKLGIVPQGTYDAEMRLNRLYLEGMQKIFLLPILFLLDKYRIQTIDNDIPTWDNCAFWKLTEKYTGAIPPKKRSNKDFDAPSKLLVSVDEEYSSHIISIVMQFQIYKHFCQIIGEYKKNDSQYPLDNCDLSNHPEVGQVLKKAMLLGASRSWHEVLKVLTGKSELDPSGFIEYFQPLYDWLAQNNRKNNAELDWNEIKSCE